MQRPSFIPFISPPRGQHRLNNSYALKQQQSNVLPMNSRTVPTLPLLIQEAPPEDARLLDAAHTLVNLQQTNTERQSRTNFSSDSSVRQESPHAISHQSSSLRNNQLSISPVRSAASGPTSSLILTHLPTQNTPSHISLMRNPVSIQMVGSTTSPLVVTSLSNPMAKTGSSSNMNALGRDNGVPERAMMPPPSSGRGGGRGSGGRGMKAKNGATSGVSSGRGRGRGRGRGSLNAPGGSQASPKGNVLQMSPQHPGLFTEDKQDHLLNSPNKMAKSPDIHAALRIITPNDQKSSDDSGNDETFTMDASNRMNSSDEKDNYSEFLNGELNSSSSNDTADSTFMVGNLKVQNSIFDDLLNERKLELFNDPEVMALLSSVMQQSKQHTSD